MKIPIIVAIAGIALSIGSTFGSAQTGPAFDCAKAKHEIEQLICQDEELAAKDRRLAEVYKRAIAAMENVDAGGREAIKVLRATQRGWIGGRNECWKAANKRQCAIENYDRRTAYLQARYFLVDGGAPVFYTCSNNPADEIVATFIATEPPSVRLERGDSLKVGILSPSATGTRYDAEASVYFSTIGDEAQVAWAQNNKFSCEVRK